MRQFFHCLADSLKRQARALTYRRAAGGQRGLRLLHTTISHSRNPLAGAVFCPNASERFSQGRVPSSPSRHLAPVFHKLKLGFCLRCRIGSPGRSLLCASSWDRRQGPAKGRFRERRGSVVRAVSFSYLPFRDQKTRQCQRVYAECGVRSPAVGPGSKRSTAVSSTVSVRNWAA